MLVLFLPTMGDGLPSCKILFAAENAQPVKCRPRFRKNEGCAFASYLKDPKLLAMFRFFLGDPDAFQGKCIAPTSES